MVFREVKHSYLTSFPVTLQVAGRTFHGYLNLTCS